MRIWRLAGGLVEQRFSVVLKAMFRRGFSR